MPTFDKFQSFRTDYAKLSVSEKQAFRAAIAKFVHDLRQGSLRQGLRIKRVQTHPGVWEMTWAPDGRATFEYGTSIRPGDPHIIWRRVGSHDVLDNP